MKRSEIDALVRSAQACFAANGWALPPNPRWDVTDFGLDDWAQHGLVLVNLAEEPEYCEKLMYARQGMTTPAHAHLFKKEDIICRWGRLQIRLWLGKPNQFSGRFPIQVNGETQLMLSGSTINLGAGERVTLVPGVYHEFVPLSEECIIGEVSTANDDLHDNLFVDARVGRYSKIEEDEAPLVTLVSDTNPPVESRYASWPDINK